MAVIRKMTRDDREQVTAMMKDFYSSAAVYTNGSDEIFERDFAACTGGSDYACGYIMEYDGKTAGYGIIAKGFCTEFGRECVWLEDIFVKQEFRNKGIGRAYIGHIKDEYPHCVLRLEAEDENDGAVRLYRAMGFDFLPYRELIFIPQG